MRKGQGIEMNVIVMAALALILLVVLIAVFTGKIQIIGEQSQCQARGGDCVAANSCEYVRTAYECPEATPECCIDPKRVS